MDQLHVSTYNEPSGLCSSDLIVASFIYDGYTNVANAVVDIISEEDAIRLHDMIISFGIDKFNITADISKTHWLGSRKKLLVSSEYLITNPKHIAMILVAFA